MVFLKYILISVDKPHVTCSGTVKYNKYRTVTSNIGKLYNKYRNYRNYRRSGLCAGVIGSDVPWLECPACNALTWVITVTE